MTPLQVLGWICISAAAVVFVGPALIRFGAAVVDRWVELVHDIRSRP